MQKETIDDLAMRIKFITMKYEGERVFGNDKDEIKRVIMYHLNQKPDLKYYINNSYIDELIDLLIEGISDAVARNTENVLQELERSQKER